MAEDEFTAEEKKRLKKLLSEDIEVDVGEPWERTINDWEQGRKPRPPRQGDTPPDVMMAYGIKRILQEIREVQGICRHREQKGAEK